MPPPIEVVPYDPNWPRVFERESYAIKEALENNCVEVHHIGSTSVPELCAKPKIDVLVIVKDFHHTEDALQQVGYKARGELNIPFRFYFTKRETSPEINLHMYEEGNPEIKLHLLFRDFLRAHPKEREAYAQLKLNLAAQESLHKKEGALPGYTLAKDAFIKNTLEQSGFNGRCIRFCTHHDEWKAARAFRQKYFFDASSLSDPYTWTFEHPDHKHFVFYQGTTIIGYAHIQLWQDKRAALRIIVLDENFRRKQLGSYFLYLCEKWLKTKEYKSLHIESSPAAYPFYIKHGYKKATFNDPDGYEAHSDDIEIAKIL